MDTLTTAVFFFFFFLIETIFCVNNIYAVLFTVTTYSRMSPPFRMWKTRQWESQFNGSSGFGLGLNTHLCTVWLKFPSCNALSLDTILHESLSLFVITSNPHAPLSDLLFPQKSRKYALNKQTNPLTKIDVFREVSPKFNFNWYLTKFQPKCSFVTAANYFIETNFKPNIF